MRQKPTLTLMCGILTAGAVLTGCQNDPSNNDRMRAEQIANPVGADDGGLNRTGGGGSEGSSASGLDRPGGGQAGTHGANSGSNGAGPATSPTSPFGATR